MLSRGGRWFLWAALSLLTFAASCGPGGHYGAPIKSTTETPVGDVLSNPAPFVGKVVVVKGQIAVIEKGGKAFRLDSGLGKYLAVECQGDFKMPGAAKYKLATVEGKLELNDKGEAVLKAHGVTIK